MKLFLFVKVSMCLSTNLPSNLDTFNLFIYRCFVVCYIVTVLLFVVMYNSLCLYWVFHQDEVIFVYMISKCLPNNLKSNVHTHFIHIFT